MHLGLLQAAHPAEDANPLLLALKRVILKRVGDGPLALAGVHHLIGGAHQVAARRREHTPVVDVERSEGLPRSDVAGSLGVDLIAPSLEALEALLSHCRGQPLFFLIPRHGLPERTARPEPSHTAA